MAKQRYTADYGRGTGHGDNREFRLCQTCGEPDADPYFTTRLSAVRTRGPRRLRNKQPRWYCVKHRPKKVVSPTDGTVRKL